MIYIKLYKPNELIKRKVLPYTHENVEKLKRKALSKETYKKNLIIL